LSFVLDFFASCEKWFATLNQKLSTEQLNYKNTSTFNSLSIEFAK